jgi:hypothetical protein
MGEEGEQLNNIRVIMDEAVVNISKTQEYADIF